MRNWKQGDPMSWRDREPTLDEMLSDPIVRSLMTADGVDRMGLEVMMRHMAAEHAGAWWKEFRVPQTSPDLIERDFASLAPGDRPRVPMSSLWAG
jgi:hypothetical protein